MLAKYITLSLLCAFTLASKPNHVARDASAVSANAAKVAALMSSFRAHNPVTQEYTIPSVTLALAETMPSGLAGKVFSAVPLTILADLMHADVRSSVASDFQAGNTPGWYNALPTDIQAFFGSMAVKLKSGEGIVTMSATPTGAASSSTSKAAAARATGVDRAVAAMAAGAMGVLGIAIAL